MIKIGNFEVFSEGNGELLRLPAVSVVGTREPTMKGEMCAGELARFFGDRGYAVVAGLARGIDTAVHYAVPEKTIAVLPTPLSVTYPVCNERLRNLILAKGGLVLSLLPEGTKMQKWHFLERDRLMALMSKATVIVESGEDGGAAKQAAYALSAGRRVFVMEGEKRLRALLMSEGAKIVSSGEEILSFLEEPTSPGLFPE